MSASTPTVHGGIGTRQLGAALAGVGLALAVLAGLAFGQLTATSQAAPAAPAAGVAPNFDHGWSTDASNVTIVPVVAPGFDHGWSTDSSNVTVSRGTGGSDARRMAR
jgi:hypothetical protein